MGPLAMRPRVRVVPSVERCEGRALTALVFVLNGNAFSAAKPDSLTGEAARVIQAAGHRAVELAYPTIDTPRAYFGLARQIRSMGEGRPIGLVGFSAGGSLAARLSGIASLNVKSVLNYYGPPDMHDWFRAHRHDRFSSYVRGNVAFRKRTLDLLSGPSESRAYVASAFGVYDRNVKANVSEAGQARNFAHGKTYEYQGGHGASILASRPALNDFLAHL